MMMMMMMMFVDTRHDDFKAILGEHPGPKTGIAHPTTSPLGRGTRYHRRPEE